MAIRQGNPHQAVIRLGPLGQAGRQKAHVHVAEDDLGDVRVVGLEYEVEVRGVLVDQGEPATLVLTEVQAAAGMGPYAASKAGVHRLTEALSAELKGKVTVNAVLPSTIDTAANRAGMPKADFSKWVTPKELADVILFLASDAASAVTGALIPVSGRV